MRTYILLLSLLICTAAKGQHQIGVDVRPGYVVPIKSFFEGNNAAGKPINKSMAYHLKYAFRFSPTTRLGQLYPSAYQGIGVGFHTFGNKEEMGNPVSVYVFQGAPIAKLTPRLSLDYEWNFGAAFGWKKYSPDTNPYNDIVGSKINAYINFGLMLNWRPAPDWQVTLGADLTHFSNGNTNYPNAGVNTLGGRIGIVRTFDSQGYEEAKGRIGLQKPAFQKHFSYDVVVYGTTRKRGIITEDHSYMVSGGFGVIGLNVNPMYNVNRYFRAGLSLDAQYDESANIKDHELDHNLFVRPSFREQFAVGASIRAELVMPIFSVNVGIGRNLIYKGDDTKGFYQILALKADVTHGAFLHVGYQLSKFKDPSNLMLGVGYRFHDKRRK